jgi:hypothetical protein
VPFPLLILEFFGLFIIPPLLFFSGSYPIFPSLTCLWRLWRAP